MKLETKTNTYQRIADLINQGIESWIEAGKIIVEETEKDPEFQDKLAEAVPMLDNNVITWFEKIGRMKLYPYLLVNDSPGVKKLRQLDYDTQKKYWHEPVPVLVKSDKGGVETLKIDIRSLSPMQARMVFARDGVRSMAAQRAWLEDKKLSDSVPAMRNNLPYRIVRGDLVISEPTKLSRKELAKILAEMEE